MLVAEEINFISRGANIIYFSLILLSLQINLTLFSAKVAFHHYTIILLCVSPSDLFEQDRDILLT